MSETELVFAYGSNMDLAQMKKRCPDSKDKFQPFVAKAEGWKLCFPRYSSDREGGVGSIIRIPGEIVRGVVYRVTTSEDMKRLDRREGVFNDKYHRERLLVTGEGGEQYETWTYFAVPNDNPPKHYAPNEKYLAFYIRGAEHFKLDQAYIEKLRKIETVK
ncbi:MAG TPA: gamma-glutamylcyclotransferase family protein [Candidatus Acidoferrum sp.]|nr:gamma-glutamylcyclotransferase family protein [Candidatus Acidoferrum sp.]